MFKGFGKQKEPSIDSIVKRGLLTYEFLKQSVAYNKELTQLLAQAVMRFTNNGKSMKHSDETNLIYGRLVVGNLFLNIRDDVPKDSQLEVEDLFRWMIDTPIEELDAGLTI